MATALGTGLPGLWSVLGRGFSGNSSSGSCKCNIALRAVCIRPSPFDRHFCPKCMQDGNHFPWDQHFIVLGSHALIGDGICVSEKPSPFPNYPFLFVHCSCLSCLLFFFCANNTITQEAGFTSSHTGEHMTEDELAQCLAALLGRHSAGGRFDLDTCDPSGTGLTFCTAQRQDCFTSQTE